MKWLLITIALLLSGVFLWKLRNRRKMKLLNDSKKQEVPDVNRSNAELFQVTTSYEKIKHLAELNKSAQKCFDANERQKLDEDVRTVFADLIRKMKTDCPLLTEEDIVFCCLSKFGLSNQIIGFCMGSVDAYILRQRKYRIKEKMTKCRCMELFNLIFEKKG
jgi:hypothetical protein